MQRRIDMDFARPAWSRPLAAHQQQSPSWSNPLGLLALPPAIRKHWFQTCE